MKSKVDYYNVKVIETPTSIEIWEYLDKPVIYTVKTEKEKKKDCLCVILASFLFCGKKKRKNKKELEVRGFDPRASPMRTVRSTN